MYDVVEPSDYNDEYFYLAQEDADAAYAESMSDFGAGEHDFEDEYMAVELNYMKNIIYKLADKFDIPCENLTAALVIFIEEYMIKTNLN
jgi:hypothetical protein